MSKSLSIASYFRCCYLPPCTHVSTNNLQSQASNLAHIISVSFNSFGFSFGSLYFPQVSCRDDAIEQKLKTYFCENLKHMLHKRMKRVQVHPQLMTLIDVILLCRS